MRETTRPALLLVLGSIAGLVACSTPSPAPIATPPISADRAKQLALAHYNAIFAARLNFRNPATGACASVPEIGVDDFLSAKLNEDAWLLERKVVTGFGFAIRVARDGSWTAVQDVYVYAE